MNAALHRNLVAAPIAAPVVLIAWMLLTFGLCRLPSTRLAIFVLAGIGLALDVAGAAAFETIGWLLPCGPMLLITSAGAAARAIEASLATFVEKVKLGGDLQMGRLVQELFVPTEKDGVLGPWRYRVIYRPFGAMSGDWVKIYHSPESAPEKVAILAMGDVVGKGPSAALITATIATVWQSHVERWDGGQIEARDFMRALQQSIVKIYQGHQNTTLSIVVLTPTTAAVASFGAPPWLKIGAAGGMERVRLKASNPIGLGVTRVAAVTLTDVTPQPGEILMAYTDGVMDGSEATRRLGRMLGSVPPPDGTEAYFDWIAASATAAGAGEVLDDDVTMLLIRRAS